MVRRTREPLGSVCSWPFATGDGLTARRRFRGIADMKRFSVPNDLSRMTQRKSHSAAALRRIVECSTAMHRDLVSYAEVSERQTSEKIKAKEW